MENVDETVEAGVTRSDGCYNYTKDLLPFSTWSLTLSGQGKIGINLDSIDIDTYATVKENSKLKETVKECGEELEQQNTELEVISPKTIGLVEYNAGAIYMGLLKGQDMTYFKKQSRKLESGNFEFQFADGLETTLNMKDIQKINEMYLITKFKLETVNNQISITEKEHEQVKETIAIYIKS